MLKNQSHKFSLPEKVSYLNCAFMSPFLKDVEKAGHTAISQKCLPFQITGEDFFTNTNILKQKFATLVNIDNAENIAVIPSVSYGIANITKNLKLNKDDEIIVLSEQFPSHIYSWQKLAKKYDAKIITCKAPSLREGRGENWTNSILEAINERTKVVAIPIIHWSDGTLFDLKLIRRRIDMFQKALLIIDGTQSIGALPFDVQEIRPDALICAGYKWLLGPYSIGLAYYSDNLCVGEPIEENWINRKNSENFANLVNYESAYQPKAGRFNVGEMSNFALTPMLIKSIEQLILWQPEKIQEYCHEISKDAVTELQNLGCFIEDETYRSSHLFGIYITRKFSITLLKEALEKRQVYVSFRGNAVRVAPHLYNTKADFDKLVTCFKDAVKI